MVSRGVANSRMKDFFDIYGLAGTRTFDGETMRAALAATLRVGERRSRLSPRSGSHRSLGDESAEEGPMDCIRSRTRRPSSATCLRLSRRWSGFSGPRSKPHGERSRGADVDEWWSVAWAR